MFKVILIATTFIFVIYAIISVSSLFNIHNKINKKLYVNILKKKKKGYITYSTLIQPNYLDTITT